MMDSPITVATIGRVVAGVVVVGMAIMEEEEEVVVVSSMAAIIYLYHTWLASSPYRPLIYNLTSFLIPFEF